MDKQQKNEDVCRALESLHNDYGKTQKDLAEWIKDVQNEPKFSESTITQLRTKKYGDDVKSEKLIKFIEAFRSSIPSAKEGKVAVVNDKLKIYLNQTFYLYFFAIVQNKDEAHIARAVLRIGATPNDVTIDNAGEDYSTNYKGSVSILVSANYLAFKMNTEVTQEKNLNMTFRVGADKVYPYAIGCYSNIGTDGAIVAGTLVLEHYKEANSENLKGEILYPNSEGYKSTSLHIRNFLKNRANNFVKVRTKGIFTDENFEEFFREQRNKRGSTYRSNRIADDDIFIAYPMSNVRDFEALNLTLKKLAQFLRELYGCKVFLAGDSYNTKSDFMPSSVVVPDDLQELKNASRFIMVYPEKVISSCLVEAGWALAEGKPSVFLYKDINDLPFSLQGLRLPNLVFIPYSSNDDMLEQVKKIGRRLFKNQ
jgi:hypothetical protein